MFISFIEIKKKMPYWVKNRAFREEVDRFLGRFPSRRRGKYIRLEIALTWSFNYYSTEILLGSNSFSGAGSGINNLQLLHILE